MEPQTSLGRIMAENGVPNWESLENKICGKCKIKPLCDAASEMKTGNSCYAFVVINTLALKLSNKDASVCQDFAKMIHESIE